MNDTKEIKDKKNKDHKNSIDYKEKYLRAKAELENYRKFTERQKADYIKFANERLIIKFLEIYDDLKRAIKSMEENDDAPEPIIEGLKMILQNMRKALEEEGVESICAIGKKFDPNLHECVMIEKDESLQDDVVCDELQEGYRLNNKVIRPSRVKIIKN
ncbi:MAG: nucleotide exchange factor GrpE [Candidatus Lokiarchaeota archaeon]|nr:nucleotide exchange factor GrpE [Candidatus Lokiarchaeota archaeon]